MRTGYIYSLVFALIALPALAIAGTSTDKPKVDNATPVMEMAPREQPEKIDLNAADAPTLQRELSGVGEAKAKAIIAYRESNGPFASVDELLEVKGIGKAILDKNREKLEAN